MEIKSSKKRLVFDIMVGEQFVATERMPVTMDIINGYDGDRPIYNLGKIRQWILQRRPTLKHQEFQIYFDNPQTIVIL